MVERQHSETVHGGVDPCELSRLGIEPRSVVDLSVNVNPFGPHPAVLRAVADASLAVYPDRHDTAARAALAQAIDWDPRQILFGHGSAELLWALVGSLPRDRPLLVVGPTFGEPQAAARAFGVPVVCVNMAEADDFALDVRAIAAGIARHAPSAVYLCQPNNPTGRALAATELQALITAHRASLFILDQAFLSLSTRHLQARLRFEDHVVLVRSLTKDHALAGLRIGYVLGAPPVLERIQARRPPWMTSSLAQAAARAAVRHPEHVAHAREFLIEQRLQLAAAVAARGFRVVPSESHFFLFRVRDADALRERSLIRQRVLLRSGRSFGLPQHVRVAAGVPHGSERLLAALAEESPP